MTNIIAHRGASDEAPENTLAAFQLAWQQSADGIESDYGYTHDRHVVCIHDADTFRTSGQRYEIQSTDLSVLQPLDVGSWKDAKYRNERIPTLRQVVQATPAGKWLVVELKTGPEIVELVERDLQQCEFDLSKLLIIAFDEYVIARSKRLMPSVKAHWLVEYDQHANNQYSPNANEIATVVARCGADGIGSQADRRVVTGTFIRELRSQGVVEFHIWTVDEPEDAVYYRDLGAWGITTNRPAKIRQALAKQ